MQERAFRKIADSRAEQSEPRLSPARRNLRRSVRHLAALSAGRRLFARGEAERNELNISTGTLRKNRRFRAECDARLLPRGFYSRLGSTCSIPFDSIDRVRDCVRSRVSRRPSVADPDVRVFPGFSAGGLTAA